MSKVKNQHFVPQFYLKRFASQGGKIAVYDKINRKEFITNVRNVASSKYFYDDDEINTKLGDQIIEKSFSDFEAISKNATEELIDSIKSKSLSKLDIEIKRDVAEFIYYQIIRTRESRTMQSHIADSIRSELLKKGADDKLLEKYRLREGQIDEKKEHLEQILNPKFAAKGVLEFLGRIWIGVENSTKHELYTSDNPIARYTHWQRGHLGMEIFTPLTPKIGIMILYRNAFKDMEFLENKNITLNFRDNVKFYNYLQVSLSSQQIFNSKLDFALARKLLKENPDLGDPNRPRLRSLIS